MGDGATTSWHRHTSTAFAPVQRASHRVRTTATAGARRALRPLGNLDDWLWHVGATMGKSKGKGLSMHGATIEQRAQRESIDERIAQEVVALVRLGHICPHRGRELVEGLQRQGVVPSQAHSNS